MNRLYQSFDMAQGNHHLDCMLHMQRSSDRRGLRELSFFTGKGGGASVCWGGGPEFFGVIKGSDQFFSVGQRGDQNFFRVRERGPKFCLNNFFAPLPQIAITYYSKNLPPLRRK